MWFREWGPDHDLLRWQSGTMLPPFVSTPVDLHYQEAGDEKTWIDNMSNAIWCVAQDPLGITIAIGHGEKVSVIEQTTLCTCAPTPR